MSIDRTMSVSTDASVVHRSVVATRVDVMTLHVQVGDEHEDAGAVVCVVEADVVQLGVGAQGHAALLTTSRRPGARASDGGAVVPTQELQVPLVLVEHVVDELGARVAHHVVALAAVA